jgi:hypothetical protein
MNKQKISFIGAMVSVIAGFIAALTMIEKISLASILTLFFSGFAAGAAFVNAIMQKKIVKK